MANLFGKYELSGAWKERFEDVTKLKAYTDKGIKVNIEDSIIGQYDLTDAVFDGAAFRDNEWNETTGTKMTFSNTTFRSNTFKNVNLEDSVFTNVTFEDSEFYRTSFFRSKLIGVKFIRCKLKSISFEKINQERNNTTVAFDNSTLERVDFDESHANLSFDHSTLTNINQSGIGFHHSKSPANLSFNHSTLTNVRLHELASPSSLTFENSELNDVDAFESELSKLVVENVSGSGHYNFWFHGNAVTEVKNSAIELHLYGNNFDKVTFENSKIAFSEVGGHDGPAIKELKLSNCKNKTGLELYKAKIDNLQISNCPVDDFDAVDATIQNFSIANSSIENSKFKGMNVVNFTLTDQSSIKNSYFKEMKVKNFILTDVELGGYLDFTGAQVEHLTTQKISKWQDLRFDLTGSNLKFLDIPELRPNGGRSRKLPDKSPANSPASH